MPPTKHRGNRFSEVLAADPSYVEWATKQGQYLRQVRREAATGTLEEFIEFCARPVCLAEEYADFIAHVPPRLAVSSDGTCSSSDSSQTLGIYR